MSSSEGMGDFGGTHATSVGYLSAGHLALGTNASDSDTDSYAAYLEAGQTYNIYLDGFDYPSEANDSAYMAVYLPDGQFLGNSFAMEGGSEGISFIPNVSGVYDIRVQSGIDVGSYYLFYENATSPDDYAADFQSSPSLTASTPLFGVLDFAKDADGFLVDIVEGTRYYVEIDGDIADATISVTDGVGETRHQWEVTSGAFYGTFVGGGDETLMVLVEGGGWLDVGSYYVNVCPTYSPTANLIVGGRGSDSQLGTAQRDEFQSSWGADTLIGGGGNDLLFGGPGADADRLDGGTGADLMVGGAGNDLYILDDVKDKVVETLSPTSDADAGGNDLVRSSVSFTLGNFIERLTLTGSGAINGTGNGLGNALVGNGAANRLAGGAGKDTLTGAAGHDVFDFNSTSESGSTAKTADVITDFTRGQDRIDLSTIDARPDTPINNAFSGFIAESRAFSAAGQLKFVGGVLYGNTDSDSAAEFAIRLTGVATLTEADLIL